MDSQESIQSSFQKICRTFNEWPSSWMGEEEDIPYGEKLLSIFRPFIEDLIAQEYSPRTIKRHCDNLWVLGGEQIRSVNMDPDLRDTDVLTFLMDCIDSVGGPYCYHLDSEEEVRSFDSTCRKLFAFLEKKHRGK